MEEYTQNRTKKTAKGPPARGIHALKHSYHIDCQSKKNIYVQKFMR